MSNRVNYSDNSSGLDDLIVAALDNMSQDYEVPSIEAVHTYLNGTATRRQLKAVQEALAASDGFQELLLEVAGEADDFVTDEIKSAFDSVVVPRSDFIEKNVADQNCSRLSCLISDSLHWLIDIFGFTRIRSVIAGGHGSKMEVSAQSICLSAFAIITTLALLIVVITPSHDKVTSPRYVASLELTHFANKTMKSSNTNMNPIDAQSAAMTEFARLITYDLESQKLIYNASESTETDSIIGRVDLILTNSVGDSIGHAVISHPCDDCKRVSIWLLSLDSLKVWTYAEGSIESLSIEIPDELSNVSCLTLIAQSEESGWISSQGTFIDVKR